MFTIDNNYSNKIIIIDYQINTKILNEDIKSFDLNSLEDLKRDLGKK